MHLNPLEIKIIGLLPLRLESPLHVGAGGGDARRTFMRLPGGELIIPSSTWKGAFRSISEQLAKRMDFDRVAKRAVEFYREDGRGISYRGDGEGFEKLLMEFSSQLDELVKVLRRLGYSEEEIAAARDGRDVGILRDMAESYIALHCPIGKLYGNKVLAGKVRFGDVVIEEAKTVYRAGIGIDRKLMTVKGKMLYFTEAINPGAEIRLPILIDNLIPGEDDSALFSLTLEYLLEFGLNIGGRKNVGMGLLNIALDRGKNVEYFYLIELNRDQELAIGNPFKKGRKLTTKQLIEYLRSK